MVTKQLISPKSIVVVGGSDDIHKPGGRTIKNLLDNKYSGSLIAVNPKADSVQGIKSYKEVTEIPDTDLAVLAIPAKMCPDAVRTLCYKKGCKAVIILSAGFHEDGPEGAALEREIVDIVNDTGASLIGPNCIGVITSDYAGAFTLPIPKTSPDGVDFITGSGATAVYILEAAEQFGLSFSSVFSVGNSAQLGVEDILEHLDRTYVHGKSAPVKILYIESVTKPQLLLKHASSLIKKGARIAAIKSGTSDAGSRAASSHTGALASPDTAVSALFRKAGIIRCYGRTDLVTTASAMMFPKPKDKKVAIVTHAGGPAVMLTDALADCGIEIPHIQGEKADKLLEKLFNGSSVANPIDFLATGTAEQLSQILDACENDFNVDSVVVIFGSPGLREVYDAYDVILDKMKSAKKPIYPVLPSTVNAGDEIRLFQSKGGISFPDEVIFASSFGRIVNNKPLAADDSLPPVDIKLIREVIDSNGNGYLSPQHAQKLLDAAGINRAKEYVVSTLKDALEAAKELKYPIVMKVVGPVHKSDVGGVALNIMDDQRLELEFKRMMKIKDTTGLLMQPMLGGTQIFIGAKREEGFGHLIMCGLGGIFIEVLHDVNNCLSPVSRQEADDMIKGLKGYKMISGTRGQEGVNEVIFNEMVRRVSALCEAAPEIFEMDINPLMGNSKQIVAVDVRIRLEKDV